MTSFLEKFDREYGPKLAGRAPTFRAVLREAQCHGVQRIVETGCARKEGNWAGDGQSTLIWHDLTGWTAGKFTTIDISKDAIELVKKLCPGIISAICGNSIEVLNKHPTPIDLLYLDSYDLDASTPHNAAMHCFMELTAAMPKLHQNSILFVDDSPMGGDFKIGGKGLYVGQFMRELGVLPFTSGYQAAWLMP